jgi:SAM-dependent methyltransferase
LNGEIKNTAVYNAKYAAGDFDYDPERERAWLKTHLIDRFQLKPGALVLDLGSGKGLHAALMAGFGLRVFGVEPSPEGIRGAISRGSDAVFIQASASDLAKYFDKGYFDVIYCRGMSWFHRELDQVCHSTGVDVSQMIGPFFEFIKPGGLFVLQICTDFSGSRPADQVHNNRRSDYRNLFSPHGEIIHLSNWAGVELIDDNHAAKVKGGVVIATRKPEH